MKKLTTLFFLLLTLTFFSCDDELTVTENLNFVTFESTSFDFGVELGGVTTLDVKVYATQITGQDRNFSVQVMESTTANGVSYLVPDTVTIPANSNSGTLPITVQDIDIDDGKTLVLSIKNEAGLIVGENITINITQTCPRNEVVLSIIFDDYASESSWELKDSNDAVIASAPLGTWGDGDATYSTKFCLEDGTYSFTMNDTYGDGLSWPSDGSITISFEGQELVNIVGDFGYSVTESFTVPNN